MSMENFPKNTFVSKATLVDHKVVEVCFRYKSDFIQKVFVSFGESMGSDFPYVAAAELFVLRERLVRGSLDGKDSYKMPTRFTKDINISLSSDIAEKAIKKMVAGCLPMTDLLNDYAQFSFFWLRNAEFFNENDKSKLLSFLDIKLKGIFQRRAFMSRGNIIDTPYHGPVEITFHAVEKCMEYAKFPRNGLSKNNVTNHIVGLIVNKNSCLLELTGKVKEDKKFYREDTENWGLIDRYLRYSLIDKGDKKVLITVYQRPFVGGKDPNERIVYSANTKFEKNNLAKKAS